MPASAASVHVHITGSDGQNLMAGGGTIQTSNGWGDQETFKIIDAGDHRSYLRNANSGFLRDNGGKLDTSVWEHDEANLKWWPAQESGGRLSFESNRGKYLVEYKSWHKNPAGIFVKNSTAGISSAVAEYNIGNSKKFTVTMQDIKFQR